MMCRMQRDLPGPWVPESWFYKWRDRPPTRRDDRRVRVGGPGVQKVFDDLGGTYGRPRIGIELRESGWQVSDNTIAQLMAELGLAARVKRRRRGLTRQGKHPAASDLVRRMFTAFGAGCRLVRRHDRDPHRRGQAIPGHGHRPVLASDPRLRHGAQHDAGAGRRQAEHGRRDPRWQHRRGDLPQRQRQRRLDGRNLTRPGGYQRNTRSASSDHAAPRRAASSSRLTIHHRTPRTSGLYGRSRSCS